MEESPDQTTGESPCQRAVGGSHAPHHNLRVLTLAVCVSAVIATALWYGLWLLLQRLTPAAAASWHLTLPTIVLTTIWILLYRENHKWRNPSQQLLMSLRGCRRGEVPIDELKTTGGGMAEIAEEIRSLLHELRQQKQTTAKLENEFGQRVANRTNALERQMSSLRAQATRDALTGLFNRRMLEECLPKMVQESRDQGSDLSILAMDVDHFKSLNDTLGHAAGDEFLRSVAQILRSGIRECDSAVRCGGDEFVVLLPGCPLSAARSLATRLTAMVAALAKTTKSPLTPGLSAGSASIRQVPATQSIDSAVTSLLAAADKQLYLAKASRKRGAA